MMKKIQKPLRIIIPRTIIILEQYLNVINFVPKTIKSFINR